MPVAATLASFSGHQWNRERERVIRIVQSKDWPQICIPPSVPFACGWSSSSSWSSGEFVARRIQSGPRFVAHSNVVLYKYVDYTPICILWAKLWAMIRFSGSRATPASTSSWFLRLMKKSKRWYNDGQKGTGSALDTWTAFILIDGRTLFDRTGDNTESRPELAQLQRRIEWELVQRLVSAKSHPVVHSCPSWQRNRPRVIWCKLFIIKSRDLP